MKILHVNAGNEFGGGLFHIISLFEEMKQEKMELLVFEDGPVAKMAREHDIKVYVLKQSSRYDLSVLKKLTDFIKDEQYEIVHTHGPRANTLFARIKKELPQTKWVLTLHSDPLLDFKGRGIKGKLFEWLNLKAIKKADHIIAVSSKIREIVINQGMDSDRITVVHNGKEHKRNFTPSFKKQDEFTLITVGRLEWVKGYTYLLDALKNTGIPEWKLLVCGTGSYESRLNHQANELGLSKNIHFLGWLNKKELEEQFLHSDLMVMPSLSESFPLVALEAGQYGLPLIASDVGDVKEILPHSGLGWLVEPENTSQLAEALKEAFELWEKDQLQRIGKEFYNWTMQFTIDKQAEETRQIYRYVIT